MIKLLTPDMPTADELLPFLRRLDQTKVYVNNGPLVRELEAALQRATGGLCVTVSNATVGLELVLRQFREHCDRLTPRVLVPTVTYVASGQAVLNAGCQPMLADVDAKTWQLTPMKVREWLDDDLVWPDIVMPVAAFGSPVPVDEWAAFYADTGIPVVIDAAGALTEESPPVPGVTIVYSMHATKFWGAGEGGVICTPHESMAEAIRSLACFGPGGTNAKMSEYHAAVGLASMLRLQGKHERTMRVFNAYSQALPEVLVDAQQAGPMRGNWTLLNVKLPADICTAETAVAFLAGRGIEARRWYAPYLHERHEFIDSYMQELEFPVADELSEQLLGLPFHMAMTDHEVVQVCAALHDLLQ